MKKILTRVLALLLTGGAAALGLLVDPASIPHSDAAPPHAMPKYLDGDLPLYPGIQEVTIGQDMDVNGQIVDMRQFFTDDSPDIVSAFYKDAFDRARPGQVTAHKVGNADYVGMINDHGKFVQVMILDAGDGSTLVVPNVATGPLRPGQEASKLPVPLPEDHQGLMTYRSVDNGRRAISAQYRTNLDLLEVAEFYRARLPELGFTQKSGAMAPGQLNNGVLRFVRPGGPYVTLGTQTLIGDGTLVFVLAESGDDSDEVAAP